VVVAGVVAWIDPGLAAGLLARHAGPGQKITGPSPGQPARRVLVPLRSAGRIVMKSLIMIAVIVVCCW
jgi:hypothetical protein